MLDSAKALVEALQHFEVKVESKGNLEHCSSISEFLLESDSHKVALTVSVGNAIAAIWADPCIEKLFANHETEFYLMDSAPYFFDEIQRIAEPDYVPTEADVLRVRTKTTGIYETRFVLGQLRIHMFDVGGQRSERKKWIHCFENVTSIIFVVALSEYRQVLSEEESSQNSLMESIVLFESITNSRWFTRTSVILFLNKVDLFKQGLERSPLGDYFPDYAGGNDINRAAKYLLSRFQQVNRAHLNLYPQYVSGVPPHEIPLTHITFPSLTQATDTSNIRLVFAAVKETILSNALRNVVKSIPSASATRPLLIL